MRVKTGHCLETEIMLLKTGQTLETLIMRVKTGHTLETVIMRACQNRPRHGDSDHACEKKKKATPWTRQSCV